MRYTLGIYSINYTVYTDTAMVYTMKCNNYELYKRFNSKYVEICIIIDICKDY